MSIAVRNRALFFGGLLLVLVGATTARSRAGDLDRPFETDEADYVRAMSSGPVASYLATRERNGVAFLAEVYDEYRRTGWARPFQRDWDADDAAGLRHYHPPLAFYPVAFMRTSASGEGVERAVRFVPLATGVAACLATVCLTWVLLEGIASATRGWLSVAAGLLVAASGYHIVSSTTLSPHAAFSLLSALTLTCLVRAIQTGRRLWWRAGCASLGVATLTVPYWLLMGPAVLWTWWVLPSPLRTARELVAGLLVVIAAAAIAWPPFVIELAFVKPALMYGGIILKPLVSVTTPGLWIVEMAHAHLAVTVAALAAVPALLLVPRDRLRAVVPVAIFVAAFLLLNLRVGHMKPMYASDVLPALAALVVGLVGWAIARAGSAAPAIAAAAAGAGAVASLSTLPARASSPEWRSSFARLDQSLGGRRVLVTPRAAAAMIKFYVPATDVVLDSGEPSDVRALRAAVATGHIDAIVRWGATTEPDGVAAGLIGSRSPDGRVEVAFTPVSWWDVSPTSGPANVAE